STVRTVVVTVLDHPGRLTGELKHCRWGHGWPSLPPASARPGRCPMATTSTSTVVAVVESVFTEPERLALAEFLAADGRRLDRHGAGRLSGGWLAAPGSPSRSGRIRCGTRSSPRAGRRGPAARRAGSRL